MPKTREQYEEIKNARKTEILNSAIKVFCEKGYEDAKIDDIMRDCRCSHGLMYHYFKNKDEIFREILTTAAAHSDEMYERTVDMPKFSRESFGHMVSNFLEGLRNDRNFAYFIHFMSTLHMIRQDFDYSALHRSHYDARPEKIFEHMFAEGQQLGFIRRDEPAKALAALFTSIFQGLAYQKVFAMTRKRDIVLPNEETLLHIFLHE